MNPVQDVWILRFNGQDQIVRSGNYCCSSIRVASIDENKNSHWKITMSHTHYTRILRTILNKSWKQDPTKQQLYGHVPPITTTIQVIRTRHAGHCWRSSDELLCGILLWTYIQQPCPVPIQDVALKTYRKRWTIEKGGGKGSGRSLLMARQDDYIYIEECIFRKQDIIKESFVKVYGILLIIFNFIFSSPLISFFLCRDMGGKGSVV